MLGKGKDFSMFLAESMEVASIFLDAREDIEVIEIQMSAAYDTNDVRKHSFLIIYRVVS